MTQHAYFSYPIYATAHAAILPDNIHTFELIITVQSCMQWMHIQITKSWHVWLTSQEKTWNRACWKNGLAQTSILFEPPFYLEALKGGSIRTLAKYAICHKTRSEYKKSGSVTGIVWTCPLAQTRPLDQDACTKSSALTTECALFLWNIKHAQVMPLILHG